MSVEIYRKAFQLETDLATANARIAELERELAEAKARNERALCVYCGDTKQVTLETMRDVMAAHIAECEKHPLRIFASQLGELEQQLSTIRSETIDRCAKVAEIVTDCYDDSLHREVEDETRTLIAAAIRNLEASGRKESCEKS